MGINNSLVSQGTLIDNYINTSYDVVKKVYDNLNAISYLGQNLTQLEAIGTNINSINAVGNSIESIVTAVNNLPSIVSLLEVLPSVYTYEISNLVLNEAYIVDSRNLYFFKSPIGIATFNSLSVFIDGEYKAANVDYVLISDFYEGAYRTALKFTSDISTFSNITLIIGVLTPNPVLNIVNRTKQALSVLYPHTGITVNGSNTVIDLSAIGGMSYTTSENQLMVFVNGVFQSLAAGSFQETSSTSITLTGLLNAGDSIDVIKVN